jgi:hypothetical protein
VGLRSSTTDRPWTVVDTLDDGQPCTHVCASHPAAPYDGPRLTLGELDQRARALPYSPGAGSGYDRGGARAWILGQAAQQPDAYMGGRSDLHREIFDTSALAIATRARRAWLDLAGHAPPGVGPAGLLGRNREADGLCALIRDLDVLEDVEELMGR